VGRPAAFLTENRMAGLVVVVHCVRACVRACVSLCVWKGLLNVDMSAHNNSGIAHQDESQRLATVVAHISAGRNTCQQHRVGGSRPLSLQVCGLYKAGPPSSKQGPLLSLPVVCPPACLLCTACAGSLLA
jgi:hypothetical protein